MKFSFFRMRFSFIGLILPVLLLLAVMSLVVQPTYAADAVQQAEEIVAPPEIATSWSGAYVAGLVGYGWTNSDLEHRNVNNFGGPGGTYTNDGSDFVYGAAVGYDYQFASRLVLGLEASVRSGFSIDDGGEWAQYNNYTATDVDHLITVAGRVGYGFDKFLPYLKAGVAFGEVETSQVYSPAGVAPTVWSAKDSRVGYVIGAGVDYKVTENIFVGLEYAYTDLGTATFSALDSSGTLTNINADVSSHTVMARMGLRF